MIVYIVRHAWAGQRDSQQWPDDRERPVTADGKERFDRVARKLARRGLACRAIATSPLVRCRQTAKILARRLPEAAAIVELEALAPGSDLDALLQWSGAHHGNTHAVAWVGHAPDVGELAAGLLGSPECQIEFAKGAVAAIEFGGPPARGAGVLRWLVTAKMLGE